MSLLRVSAQRLNRLNSSLIARPDVAPLENKVKVGILGASGAVGSRFLHLLQGHPWFEVVALGGGPHEVGQQYKDISDKLYNFLDPNGIPADVATKQIISPEPKAWKDAGVNLVFSAVPPEVAEKAEQAFADAGIAVFSNATTNRMRADVPLLQPYVNPEHMELYKQQAYENVVPYIGDEEDKIETEPQKILGALTDNGIQYRDIKISATANRVAISDGHMICCSVKLGKQASVDEVKAVFKNFKAHPAVAKLPSCPTNPIRYFDETRPDRPQHRLDRMYGGGMGVNVGRVRGCNVNDIRFTCLGHNTIIGAAGGSIINAELAVEQGMVK